MKHFIGGFAVGLILAIRGIPADNDKSNVAYAASFVAHMFIASIFGLMAWGLLP